MNYIQNTNQYTLKVVAGDGLFGRLSSYHSLAANGGMETRTVHGKHRYSVYANLQNLNGFIYNEFLVLDYHKLSFEFYGKRNSSWDLSIVNK